MKENPKRPRQPDVGPDIEVDDDGGGVSDLTPDGEHSALHTEHVTVAEIHATEVPPASNELVSVDNKLTCHRRQSNNAGKTPILRHADSDDRDVPILSLPVRGNDLEPALSCARAPSALSCARVPSALSCARAQLSTYQTGSSSSSESPDRSRCRRRHHPVYKVGQRRHHTHHSSNRSLILGQRASRGRERSIGRYRHRTDYDSDRSPIKTTNRRSRSFTRRLRKSHSNSARDKMVSPDDRKIADGRKRKRSPKYDITRKRYRSRLPDRYPCSYRQSLEEERKRPGEFNTFENFESKRRRTSRSSRDRSNIRRKGCELHYIPDEGQKIGSKSVYDKFLGILDNVTKSSGSKLSHSNAVPEFDPADKNQTIWTWLKKVEECAEIYGWGENEIIHFALPKLMGIAKTWYKGLDTLLYSWNEWKNQLTKYFPEREDFAELLTLMLSKTARFGESLDEYFYEKLNLLNRCDIHGRNAVDCILHGVEDRTIRVGAQAVQFREPEEVLKYFKTVKVGNNRRDRTKQDRKVATAVTSANDRKQNRQKPIVCFNCKTEGHIRPDCPKPKAECSLCKMSGHLSDFCRLNKTRNNTNNESTSKEIKNVAELTVSGESNKKYYFNIRVNDRELSCHLDLGSQCTLIREMDARHLNLHVLTNSLPILRGIGGHYVRPLGRCKANVAVQGIEEEIEMFIVDDHVLQYPVLLGHSFTERPNIVITKTPDEIIFERPASKIRLSVSDKVTTRPGEICAVPVDGEKFTGTIYIHGSLRGPKNLAYYLFPGEYSIKDGIGQLVILNMSDQDLTFEKGGLMARVGPAVPKIDVALVTFNQGIDESINCGEQVPEIERIQIKELLARYNDCFSSGLTDLGFTSAGEMVIELENTEPVVYRPYRLSYSERSLVRGMVSEMLDAGIIKESSSPYASPIVLVKKKTGEKRLCIDYRALNKRTKKDHYPIPLIEDQLDRLAGNRLFISLDLASGYYQIPISEESQSKTAFVTPDGQYEFTRMPFGLVNAPSVFQRIMNKILLEAKIKYALVYMDDILIPARTFEEGMQRLEEVLSLLKSGGLTLKLSKCSFFSEQVDFLGFEVSADGIKPGKRKTEAVAKFPTPKNVHEVRQFYGLASFFRRFIQGFAEVARPLSDLLTKDREWKWGAEQIKAFDNLKAALISRPILALYDPKRETQLHTDASKFGVAGILLQKSDLGHLQPVAYFSRKTTPAEEKMHSFDLETLAVVASLVRFRIYLLGVPFKIFTDCNALRTTLSKRDLIPRIARWWIQLQEFDCEIEYRSGSRMMHADALSRNPVSNAKTEDHILDVLVLDEVDWITTVQGSDDDITQLKVLLNDPQTVRAADVLKHYKLKNDKVYRIIEGDDGDNLRWVVPKGARWQVTKMNHDDIGHFGYEKTLARIKQTFWFQKMNRFVKKYVRACLECAHHKGVTGKQHGELHPIPKIEIPFHTIHADHLGPFIRSTKGNSYILVIIDGFTKFINIAAVRDTKTTSTVKVMREHIKCFGTPTRMITDQGTSFTSKTFREFTKMFGIRHILNAVATPRANGQVERFNRTILEALSAKCHGEDDNKWDEQLIDVQIGLNTTVHKTTGKSPSELLFGFRLKSRTENILSDVIDDTLDKSNQEDIVEIRAKAGQRIRDQQVRDKEAFDSKRRPSKPHDVGNLVSVRREVQHDGKSKKLVAKYQGPYRVLKVLPNDRYLIEDTPLTRKSGNRRYENIVAADKLKPWLTFNREFDSSPESDSSGNSNH